MASCGMPCAVLCLVSQLCRTLCDPWTVARQAPLSMGILQATILEWVAMPSSRGSSQPRDQTQASLIAGGFFAIWATRETPIQRKKRGVRRRKHFKIQFQYTEYTKVLTVAYGTNSFLNIPQPLQRLNLNFFFKAFQCAKKQGKK